MSSAILVLLLLVWISGYFFRYGVDYTSRTTTGYYSEGVSVFNGGIFYASYDMPDARFAQPGDIPPETGVFVTTGRNDNPTFLIGWSHAGFFAFTTRTGPNEADVEFTQAGVPFWFLCLLCVPVIIWRLWVIRRQRLRLARQFCIKCGYDLRASSDCCPECGQPIPQSPAVETA